MKGILETVGRSAILLLVVLVCTVPHLHAYEKTDAKVKLLIEQLASKNKPPPRREGSPDPESNKPTPADYDFEAQEVVYKAADELVKLGINAIPELVRHVKDEPVLYDRNE